ncbi:Hsp70 family protein [Candida albicans]|uniref:Hsp70 family protein n=1 Tax=Candida albicans TaxID=5476 RepID=A0A8H6BVL8_CANAX|nr:Hsp70 family protein [Candida albicans]
MKGSLFIFYILSIVFCAILGIDYGQQFTKAVLLAPGVPFEIVLTDEGKRKDLSGLCIRKVSNNDLERVYGSQMGSLVTRFPHNCILDLKQLLGKSIDDPSVNQYLKNHFVKLVADEARNGIKFDLGFNNSTLEFSVEEILAMNLNEIKSRALNDLEANPHAAALVEDVAVSIPPFASQAVRQAYLDSLALANFSNVLGLVEEGTSVALNYITNKKLDKDSYDNVKHYYLIYDVGAGYTTTTLFSFTPKSIGQSVLEIESIGYDEMLGGKTLTNSAYSLVLEKFLNQFNLEESDLTDKIAARLQDTAEKAKIILSANSDFQTTLESVYNEKDFKLSITRQEFEDINADIMNHIADPVLKTVLEAGLKVDDIEYVILNGGSTRVPFIQKHIATLVGENKISKSVNTDESSALGTTAKALRLKAGVSSEETKVVFAKGATIGNTTRVHLGKISEDRIAISLYENGALIKSYNFDDLLSKAKKLDCKLIEDKNIFGKLSLDNNKIFDLVGLEVECSSGKEGSFFDKLMKKGHSENDEGSDNQEESTPENSTNSTKNSNSSKKVRSPKVIYVPVSKPSYPHIKPIGRVAKQSLLDKLAYLKAQDELKIATDHIKNELEELLQELSEQDLEETTTFVGDLIEWLDFESDDSTLDELNSKVDEVNSKFSEVRRYKEIATTDLSKEGLKKLYDDSSNLIMKIQTTNERIKQILTGKGEDKMLSFDKTLKSYKQVITEIAKVLEYDDKDFSKVAKSQLYSYHEKLAKGVADMFADVISIESLHLDRMELFNQHFEQLLERKKQQELRRKLREAQKAAKEEQKEQETKPEEVEIIEEEDEVVEEVPKQTTTDDSLEQNTNSVDENSSTENKKKPDVEHDEL